MQRPVAKRSSYAKLWREFLLYRSAFRTARRLAFADATKARGAMNVSTVFPEGYTVNEQIRRTSVDVPKEDESEERYERAKDFVGLEEVSKIEFLTPMFAEALGTCLLVLIGCASCVAWAGQGPTIIQIAFTFGLTVASLAQAIGPVSGCHVNPAVTIGLLVSGNCSFLKSLCYVVCQCSGAIAGAALLQVLYPSGRNAVQLGATDLGLGMEAGQGILMEAIITFLLVLVVHSVTDTRRSDAKGWAPLAIGLTIAAAHMAAVPFTGSSMNPARSLGPAVILGEWKNQYVYWAGPIIGALVAGGVFRLGFRAKKDDDEASYDF